jgi:hypothetical protein
MTPNAIKQLAQNMLLALVIGLGAMTAWLLVCGILSSLYDQWHLPPVYESIHVAHDGRVLVSEWHRDAGYTAFRTLDGQPVTDQKALALEGAVSCQSPMAKNYPLPMPWGNRMIGFHDLRVPPNHWYLVDDGQPESHAHFVGYDSQSKRQIGYIGLKGFQSEVPTPENQFVFPSAMLNRTGAVAGALSASYSLDQMSWIAHVLSDGKLYRVNLDRRSVEQVPFPDPIVSIDVALQPKGEPEADLEVAYDQRVLVRTSDKLVFLDFEGKTVRTVPLPENVRGDDLDVYRWWLPTVLLVHRQGGPSGVGITWVDTQNNSSKHLDIALRGEAPFRPALLACGLAFALVGAVPFAVAIFFIVPLLLLFFGISNSFAESFAMMSVAGWPALVGLGLLGIGLAVVSYRRQRRLGLEGAALWAVFVALLGVPGWIGYQLHRRWPLTERCTHCGVVAQCDREACFSCHADFALPASKGIEIFA